MNFNSFIELKNGIPTFKLDLTANKICSASTWHALKISEDSTHTKCHHPILVPKLFGFLARKSRQPEYFDVSIIYYIK